MRGRRRALGDEVLDFLPVFPLPRTVFVPGIELPLHIFEPRYRALVEHCMSSHRVLAVALLKPGCEESDSEPPALYEVMGAGVIVKREALPDGRANILVRGTERVRAVEELPLRLPFRVVRAERLPDDRRGSGIARNEQTLRFLVKRLARVLPRAGEPLHRLLAIAGSPGELGDLVAHHLVGDPLVVQQVLEELDVERRLELVCERVVELCLRFDPGWIDRSGPLN